MDFSAAEKILQAKSTLAAVAILTALLFVVTNLPWVLDDYDQAQQAFTSYEMINEGHWFYQRTPYGLIAQKPPLVGWASAACYSLTGSWNIAWRVPPLVAAVALAVVLFRTATSAYGTIPGLVGLSAFGLNLLSVRLATLVRTDMPLAFAIFLVGLMIFEKVRKREEWAASDQWWFFALLAASMLIKGPFVCLFVLPAVLVCRWRYRTGKIAKSWPPWWPWLASLTVLAAWIVGGIYLLPHFYHKIVAFEFLDRLDPSVHRAQPVYFYLVHLLHKFAPWSILMPAFAILTVRQHRRGLRSALGKIAPETWWLISWSFVGLVIMSFVPSKRVDRVFAVVPPLCLLLSAQVARALADEQLRRQVRRWTAAALAFAMLFSTSYSAWKIVTGYHDRKDALVKFGRAVSREAAAHGWRYDVVSAANRSGTEGMLLYLQKLRFIQPQDAVEKWNSGQLDALVIPNDRAPSLMSALRQAEIAPLRTAERKDENAPGYILVTRSRGS